MMASDLEFTSNANVEIAKLNLGCGQDYREGWVNADLAFGNIYNKEGKAKRDVTVDLCEFPYPFEDNQFDHILCNHVLEHTSPLLSIEAFFNEIWRILKVGGTIEINVPHFSSWNAYAFDHKRFFNCRDFIDYVPVPATNQNVIKPFTLLKRELHSRIYLHTGGKTNLRIRLSKEGIYNMFVHLIDKLANINPVFTERFWCYYVGGFAEMHFVYRKETSK